MTSPQAMTPRQAWMLILAASATLMITMGARLTTGLFLSPINTSTGLGIASISFAMAVAQLIWGASQPLFGAIADKYGPARVIVIGGLMLAVGTAATPFVDTQWGLILTMGLLSAAGAGAGSFSILIGATAQRLPAERRAFASGFINAGGSFGQFVFAPLMQAIIASAGWVAAMLTMAASTLLTIPLALGMRGKKGKPAATSVGIAPAAAAAVAAPTITLTEQLRQAARDRSYLCLHLGFFTCGFHIAFLVTHLPGEVALCGLPASVSAVSIALIGLFNVAGSLIAGKLGERYRMKWILAAMYASRALLIVLYLLAPPSALTFYLFAAGLVGKLFGPRYLGTLFGLTLLTHQIGGFFGAWLGGVALEHSGSYQWMWYADIVLALLAAAANLPIRERALEPVAA